MLPKDFRKKIPIYLVAIYIFALGLSYIFSVVFGLRNRDIARTVGSPVQSVLLGLGLIYLSASLLRGLYRAWLITLSILVIALLREIILIPHSLDLTNVALVLVAGVSLFLLRSEFKAKSEPMRLKSSLLVALILLLVALTFGTIGFTRLPEQDFGRHFTASSSFTQTIGEFTMANRQPLSSIHARRTEAFVLSLHALGVASIILAGYALLQPLIYRSEHRVEDVEKARELLKLYGGNSEDYFKLWPLDKDYIFSDDSEAALAYCVRSGVAISAGDPFGKHTSYDNVLTKFQTFCRNHGFDMAFVHVTDRHQKLYEKHQLVLQKIGEEAVVPLQHFAEHTIRNKKWRHVMNKFEKLGYSFELCQPPHSETLLSELKRVSDSWLETPGRVERGFTMGYFDTTYMASCELGIVKNEEQQIAGFLNLIESYDPTEANMDLFRQRAGSPTNMTDYMVAQTLLTCADQGFDRFNLGLCPLHGMDSEGKNGPISKALALVYNFGGKLYSFKGLQQFKAKFEPDWRIRYIALEPGALSIAKTAQALRQAMKIDNEKQK